MKAQKIVSNLYKYNDNSYWISINRKNNDGKQVVINEYITAKTDEEAINCLNIVYKENNLSEKKQANSKIKKVDKYIYKYGKDYYRITIKKSKLFPDGIDEYYYLPLKEVKIIRDNYIAQAKLHVLEKKGLNEKYKDWTLRDFKPEYIEKYCVNKLSEVTIDWYNHMIDYYIMPEFGDYKLIALQDMVSDIQKFVNNLKNVKKKVWKKGKLVDGNETISTKTQNSIYGIFKGFLTKAVDFKAIESNPLDSITAPEVQNKETQFFTLDEMYEVLDMLKKEYIKTRFMFTLIICTGIRRGELVGLHIDDLDFENDQIRIEREVVAVKGKGIIEKEPKSKNSIRIIPVPHFCMELAKKYLEERERIVKRLKELYGDDLQIPDNLFLSRFGKIMYPDTPYDMWVRFREKHVLKEVTVHGLRHSWCTAELHENDFLTDVEVAKLMGHGKNVNMTMHYNQPIDRKINKSTAIFSQYEENLKTDKGNLLNFSYEELITILSGKPYTNLDRILNMVKKYYDMSDDELTISELSIHLFGMKEDLIAYDSYYQTIENYLSNDLNDDWKILTDGKEKFGDSFQIAKKIINLETKEKISI